MASLNKIMVIGNLTREVQFTTTAGGTSVANFAVATNERVKKNGEWTDHVEYHDVVFFGKTAEVARDHLAKGREVYVEGASRKEKYTNKDNEEKLSVKILGEKLVMLGSKGGKGEGGNKGQGGGGQQSYEEPAFDPSEDIPF